jgi:hypothetical protein
MPILVEEGFTFATFLMILAIALPSRMAEEASSSRGGACPCGRPRGWVAALARGFAAFLAFANKVFQLSDLQSLSSKIYLSLDLIK